MTLELKQILYFGHPGSVRTPTKNSIKPPKDYKSQEELYELLKNYKYPIIYVDINERPDLIARFDISDSHTWVLEFDNNEFEKYENDIPFFKRISEF